MTFYSNISASTMYDRKSFILINNNIYFNNIFKYCRYMTQLEKNREWANRQIWKYTRFYLCIYFILLKCIPDNNKKMPFDKKRKREKKIMHQA